MKEAHKTRLESLSEKLIDVVLDETDPANWPGKDKTLAELTQEERGDRYWCKKNAAATLTLATKVQSLLGMVNGGKPQTGADSEVDMDKEIKAMERKAQERLNQLSNRTGTH